MVTNFLLQREKIGEQILTHTPIPIRVIRAISGQEYIQSIPELIWRANDYQAALELISKQHGFIPDGSNGLRNLIHLYRSSSLRALHEQLDDENYDPPEIWDQTYRNFAAIKRQQPAIGWMLDSPNPTLKNPTYLTEFIHELYEHRWSPKHIVGLLAAIYTAPQFGWGTFFEKNDPNRHAMGWVSIILGRRYQ